MKQFKRILKIIRPNRLVLLSYELVFRLLSAALFPPLFKFLFFQVMKVTGFRYLTAENLLLFIRNPLILMTGILLALLYAWFEIVELGGLLYIIDQSRSGRRTSFLAANLFSLKRSLRVLRKENILLLPVVLILWPFLHLPTILNYVWFYSLPEWIIRTVRRYWFFTLPAAVLVLMVLFLFLRWMFAVHYYYLENLTAKQAMRKSSELRRSLSVKRTLSLFVLQLVSTVLFIAAALGVFVLITAFMQLIRRSGAAISTVQIVYLGVALSLFDALMLPMIFTGISILFYRAKRVRKEGTVRQRHINEITHQAHLVRWRMVETVIVAVAAAAGVLYIFGVSRGRYTLRIDRLRTMQVTAHRGASMFYPENTMAAFRGAVEQGTDWIELDVQESLDGQIFVMHDTSFKRTTGVDRYAWELTYDEISRLDAGSWFNSSFEGEKIPLLSEVIEYAKEAGVRLNIELKPSGHEQHLVEKVVELVEEAGFEEECVITSQAYKIVEEVKERNEIIQTVYVMGLAYGAINRLKAADAFSIRGTSISQSMVRDLHNRGIEVYAWTVDSRKNINRMINLGVDNIITNNVPGAVECINHNRTSNLLTDLTRILRMMF